MASLGDRLLNDEWFGDRHTGVVAVGIALLGFVAGTLAIESGSAGLAGGLGIVALAAMLGFAKFASP